MKISDPKSWIRLMRLYGLVFFGVFGFVVLLGSSSIFYDRFFSISAHHNKWNSTRLMLFLAINILIGLHFLYTGYLGWLKFSPMAVRHACVNLTFIFWVFITTTLDRSTPERAWWVCLIILVVAYLIYHFTSNILIRVLFTKGLKVNRDGE